MKIEKKETYTWKEENECTRNETREEENWYMQQPLTGAEAMRACQLFMQRVRRHYPEDHYMKFVIETMWEECMYSAFAMALEETMDEREALLDDKWAPRLAPFELEHTNWEDCECCNECKWGPKRKEVKPWLGRTKPYTPEEVEEMYK